MLTTTSTVAFWLLLLPPWVLFRGGEGLSACSLHFLPMSLWVSLGGSGFPQNPKHTSSAYCPAGVPNQKSWIWLSRRQTMWPNFVFCLTRDCCQNSFAGFWDAQSQRVWGITRALGDTSDIQSCRTVWSTLEQILLSVSHIGSTLDTQGWVLGGRQTSPGRTSCVTVSSVCPHSGRPKHAYLCAFRRDLPPSPSLMRRNFQLPLSPPTPTSPFSWARSLNVSVALCETPPEFQSVT